MQANPWKNKLYVIEYKKDANKYPTLKSFKNLLKKPKLCYKTVELSEIDNLSREYLSRDQSRIRKKLLYLLYNRTVKTHLLRGLERKTFLIYDSDTDLNDRCNNNPSQLDSDDNDYDWDNSYNSNDFDEDCLGTMIFGYYKDD